MYKIIDNEFRDILPNILSYLDIISLRNTILICKQFYIATNNYINIKKICLKIPIYKEYDKHGENIKFKIYRCLDIEADLEIRKFCNNGYTNRTDTDRNQLINKCRYILYKKYNLDMNPIRVKNKHDTYYKLLYPLKYIFYIKIYKNNRMITHKLCLIHHGKKGWNLVKDLDIIKKSFESEYEAIKFTINKIL